MVDRWKEVFIRSTFVSIDFLRKSNAAFVRQPSFFVLARAGRLEERRTPGRTRTTIWYFCKRSILCDLD